MSPAPQLDDLPAWCWTALAEGAAAPGHGFHTAVVATVHGQDPEARTVVLRATDTPARALWFHTDRRSAKVRSLDLVPRLAWVFWDAGSKIQLRCSGPAQLEATADEIAGHWASLHENGRSLYPGIEQFLPIRCTVEAMDWLRLDRAGHLRARLHWDGERWGGEWIEP